MNSTHTFSFFTNRFEECLLFFKKIGFTCSPSNKNPFGNLFGELKAARITRGSIDFNLEETFKLESDTFNLFIPDGYTLNEINKIAEQGISIKSEISLYGKFHTIDTPLGGKIVICTSEK